METIDSLSPSCGRRATEHLITTNDRPVWTAVMANACARHGHLEDEINRTVRLLLLSRSVSSTMLTDVRLLPSPAKCLGANKAAGLYRVSR